jgi:hypothetical protein
LEAFQTIRTSIQFQAERCNLKWVFAEVGDVLRNLSDSAVLRRLGIRKAFMNAGKASKEERATVKLFFELSINVAAVRSWSMLAYYWLAPDHWAGALDADPIQARICMLRVKHVALLIQDAEEFSKDKEFPEHEVRACC